MWTLLRTALTFYQFVYIYFYKKKERERVMGVGWMGGTVISYSEPHQKQRSCRG
jgi:hypothetical protein